ncbi:hypothetical protein FRC15_006671 [Serendipita sp. 397]|nr:hypothetical protein FRC15_006671 [Serendipita sp. 397]
MASDQAQTSFEEDLTSRYFKHEKTATESSLRSSVPPAKSTALEQIFASQVWMNQTGELDRFQLQSLLEIRRDDENRESFHCIFNECGYGNYESTNAIEHVRGTHFGNRPYLCDQWYDSITCKHPSLIDVVDSDKAFTRKHDLRTHEQTHDQSSKNPCPTCGNTFTRSSNLMRHIRSAHGGSPIRSDEGSA